MNEKQYHSKISLQEMIGYLLIGLSVIMLGRSFMLCFSNDIWYDELFTVGMTEHSYGDLIAFTARDVHPPLYYCIVKFIVDLCKLIVPTVGKVAAAKIVSVFPYFILLLYSVIFIRRRFGILTGGLFMFCVISMPQLSAYTVEIRMYSWALLFVTAAFLHAYGIVAGQEFMAPPHRKSNAQQDDVKVREQAGIETGTERCVGMQTHYIALVLYGLAAAYTQYFACVAVIMVYLYVLIVFIVRDRKRIRQWIACVMISVAGYVPWLYALYTQITAVGEEYWILPLGWRTFGGCVKFMMKPAFTNNVLSTVLAVILFGVCTFIFMWNVVKLCYNRREYSENSDISKNRSKTENGNYDKFIVEQWDVCTFMAAGIGVLAGLILFGFAASVLFRPIFVYRYMIPALGCFWLSFAVGLGMITGKQNHETKQPTAFFAAVCALILLIGLRDYRAFMGEEEYKILLMKDTGAAFEKLGAEDILIFNFDQVQMVTGYYLDNDSYLWYGKPEALIQEISGEKGSLNENIEQIKEWISQGRKVRFIGSFNSREDIVEEWHRAGITVVESGSYLLERYWFNIYDLSVEE